MVSVPVWLLGIHLTYIMTLHCSFTTKKLRFIHVHCILGLRPGAITDADVLAIELADSTCVIVLERGGITPGEWNPYSYTI